jgi:hypothetical protein
MLPSWADQVTVNNCSILYGGFNPHWTAGQHERHVVDQLAQSIVAEYPSQRSLIVVPSWYDPLDIIEHITAKHPDILVVCSLTDPLGSTALNAQYLADRVIPFGYVDTGIKYDFWAVVCKKNFRQYTANELLPTQLTKLYLNYNRKPHYHRTNFVRSLEQNNLIDLGYVTLGGTNYLVDDQIDDYQAWGANDAVGKLNIPNDIYSLGRVDIWQSCFINIVSETEYSSYSCFLSEKTFKPIIGLRPFIINGNPRIYKWLIEAGFDCFTDLFPVDKLSNTTSMTVCHDIIIDCLKFYQTQDWQQIYKSILPRLYQNQKHFYEYVNQQNTAFNNLHLF